MNMVIRNANMSDCQSVLEIDKHISRNKLVMKIKDGEILVLIEDHKITGLLRYGYYWDEYPFINMLYIVDGCWGRESGRDLVSYWERKMKEEGHEYVMTSAFSNEEEQNFYRKLGYRDIEVSISSNELELMLTEEDLAGLIIVKEL
jgi:N-acetylglutamate synthase-like GNAT family acetyltransferase